MSKIIFKGRHVTSRTRPGNASSNFPADGNSFNLTHLLPQNLRRKIASLLKNAALTLAGIIFSLLIAELGLRAFYFLGDHQLLWLKPDRTTLAWREDSDIGPVFFYPNEQGWFVTQSKEYFTYVYANSEGFYDSEHSVAKPVDTYRILIVGDSFAQNLQLPLNQTYFKQLESKLNSGQPRRKVEIIVMGMGDTSTAQQYLTLKKYGLKYHPDLVIQMLLTANNIKNNSPALKGDIYRPYFVLDQTNGLHLLPHKLHSQDKLYSLKSFLKKSRVVELALNIKQSIHERLQNSRVDYPTDYHIYDPIYNHEFKDAMDVTEKIILREKSDVEASGGKYLLTVLANNEQVNQDVWQELLKTYPNMAKSNLNLEKPDQLLGRFCQVSSLNCLFMLPKFQQFVKQHPYTQTHFKYDGHWNLTGNTLAAHILVNYLKDNFLNQLGTK